MKFTIIRYDLIDSSKLKLKYSSIQWLIKMLKISCKVWSCKVHDKILKDRIKKGNEPIGGHYFIYLRPVYILFRACRGNFQIQTFLVCLWKWVENYILNHRESDLWPKPAKLLMSKRTSVNLFRVIALQFSSCSNS